MQTSHVLIDCAIATIIGAACGAYIALQSPAPAWFVPHLLAICATSFIALILWGRDHLRLARGLLILVCASTLCIGAHEALSPHRLPQIDDALLTDTHQVQGRVIQGCRPAAPPCGFEAELQVTPPKENAKTTANSDSSKDNTTLRTRIFLHEGHWSPLPGDVFHAEGKFRRPMRGLHPFAFDPEAWSQRQGIAASFHLEDLPRIQHVHPTPARRIDAHRAQLERAMMRPHREEASGILIAMSTGTKSGLSDEVRARFAAAGTAHVLAVSGLHLGLLAAILWWTLRRIFHRFPSVLRRWNADALSTMITLPVLGVYIIFTGMPTSAMRAGWMAAALLIPRIFQRRGSNLHGICIAIVILLTQNPRLIVDLGFQLSVSATLSLILLARGIQRRRQHKKAAEEARKAEEALHAHDQQHDHSFLFGQLGNSAQDEGKEVETNQQVEQKTEARTEGVAFHIARLRYRLGRALRAAEPVLFWTASAIEVSVVSTLATAPFLVWNFGGVPVFSPLPNLIIVPPLSLLALPIGVAGAALHALWPWAGTQLIDGALWVIDGCLWIARHGAGIFEQELLLGRPQLLGVIGWALVAAAAPFIFRKGQRKWWALTLFGVLAIGIDARLRAPAKDALEIHAIPVGQGDATWIRFPGGRSMLIDGGGVGYGTSKTGAQYVLPYLRGHGVGTVDILVATHGHADHVNGITELVPLLNPEQVWVGDDDLERPVDRALFDAAKAHDVPYLRPHQHWQEVTIGPSRIEVLPMQNTESINDGSLVLRICYKDFCAMMTGDAEAPRERELVQSGQPLQAQYLKVGHHGSQTSTTEAFLSKVAPHAAVIELGVDNRFGFPHEEVLDRLHAHDVQTWRTDRGEAVVHATDGARLWKHERHRWPKIFQEP